MFHPHAKATAAALAAAADNRRSVRWERGLAVPVPRSITIADHGMIDVQLIIGNQMRAVR
jgi:hypothetical protein